MHHYRNHRPVFLVLLASVLEISKCAMAPVAAWLLISGILRHERDGIILGLGAVAGTLASELCRWMAGRATYCPLCRVPVLGDVHCATHRRARRLL